ncbi:hypothetical protein OK351_17145 [Glutamicibacter sp. MNS18]|uniref:hypothetical protein n=1 Tax=Glutamicibacter sp. MNS18 TaxID=2989817 RepID=UPI0022359F29|nr:hypothetical protein [Glutamicibacter sp. MNS18]MCW4467209.1 hypothetical protein [Glutamicibacter sp. MNS18]
MRFSGPEREYGYFIFGAAGPRSWLAGQELSLTAAVEALGYVIVDNEHMPTSEVDFKN